MKYQNKMATTEDENDDTLAEIARRMQEILTRLEQLEEHEAEDQAG